MNQILCHRVKRGIGKFNMPPIEGRIERIGRFVIPDTHEQLEKIFGKPFQIGKGWKGTVIGLNGAQMPLSRITIEPKGQRKVEYPVRMRNKKAKVQIRLRTRERNTLVLRRV